MSVIPSFHRYQSHLLGANPLSPPHLDRLIFNLHDYAAWLCARECARECQRGVKTPLAQPFIIAGALVPGAFWEGDGDLFASSIPDFQQGSLASVASVAV